MDVTGIILADGKNPKLGGNKGTELIGGVPVIERVVKALTPITSRILLVTGGDTITFSTVKGVEVINDNHSIKRPLTGKQIPFRDLPGGLVYYPTFIKRTIEPISEFFGKDQGVLIGVGKMLGARPGETGDASLVIDAFARVPINIILWQGDDELKAEVNILFDANILDYLTSEDVTIVCETITWRLINYAKKV